MTIVNLLKEKQLRKRLYYTIGVLAVASLLTQIPVIGVNSDFLSSIFTGTSVLQFMDAISGGALGHLSCASFGISAYITAMILLQLATILFPSIDRIRKDGEKGRKKIENIEFILAMIITVSGSLMFSIAYGKLGLFTSFGTSQIALAVCSWVLGSIIIILPAQKVSTYGIGNGITLVLGFNILSRVPSSLASLYQGFIAQQEGYMLGLCIAGFMAAFFIFYLIGIYLQCGTLNITIKQTKKGASIVSSDGYIPMHVNIANVLPVIYASTIIIIPSLIVTLFKIEPGETAEKILSILNTTNWYSPSEWYHPLGLVLYILLVVMFGFFSSSLSFNSAEVAENMRKNGDTIPYVKPGEDTVRYLECRRKILSIVNVIFLLVLTIIPDYICSILNVDLSFLGTSLVIVIAMLFDTAFHLRAASIHNDGSFALFGRKVKV